MRTALVLRPAPGNAATVARLAGLGVPALAVPLFHVVPCDWTAPDPEDFDALLLTSANAVRHAGAALTTLAHLPVVAVGAATAAAARGAGLSVAITGEADAADAVARAAAFPRLLHLAGRERVALPGVTAITVYASDALDPPPGMIERAVDGVVLLHSARAARRFVELAQGLPRERIRIVAISAAVADAASAGWAAIDVAGAPTDAALIALAAARAIDP
jgi:uroporphyrinogen-III synthase